MSRLCEEHPAGFVGVGACLNVSGWRRRVGAAGVELPQYSHNKLYSLVIVINGCQSARNDYVQRV